jgi:hypothetical protein
MKTWQVAVPVAALLALVGIAIYFGSNKPSTGLSSVRAADVKQANGQLTANFLAAVVNYSHEGYQADQVSANLDPNDTTSMMAAIMETIDDEKQAVSLLTQYASSTNSNIASAASLMAASEEDVVMKRQDALNIMRQISNGANPTNVRYTLAQVQAAQDERNNNLILASSMLPYLTMDISSSTASSTETVGQLDPSGVLTGDEKASVETTLQMDFGDTLTSEQDDIFLLLAQEINLLLTSPSYTDFHNAWINKVASLSN